MRWWRMGRVAWRLAWPYLACPWRSSLLRWRMETYGMLDAEGQPLSANAITPRLCVQFLLTRFPQLVRFLRWAAELPRWP